MIVEFGFVLIKINMKNLILIIIFLCVGCTKSPFENFEIEKVWPDPTVSLKDFKSTILGNKNGWEFLIHNKGNNSMHYGYLNFKSENSSEFLSDFAPKYYNLTPSEINIQLVEINAGIVFPTRSKLSLFALESNILDSIYIVKSLQSDTITLEGQTKRSTLTLIKVNESKLEKIRNNKIGVNKNALAKILKMPKFFFQLEHEGKKVDLDIDTVEKTFNLRYTVGDKLNIDVFNYYFDADGIKFHKNLIFNNRSFEKIIINSISESEALLTNGLKIINYKSPIFHDPMAIKVIEGTNISFGWGSTDGFSTRDKTDITKFKKIKNFSRFILFPRFDTDTIAKKDHGFMGILLRGDYVPGSDLPEVHIKSNNIIKFTPFKLAQNPSEELNVLETKKLLYPIIYNKIGFYVIQMRNGFFLVDARDALTWIYFQQAMS